MATSLKSQQSATEECPVAHPYGKYPGARRGVHYASCVALGVLAMSLSLTAVGVVVATERGIGLTPEQNGSASQRSSGQRSLRDPAPSDDGRPRNGAKTQGGPSTPVAVDVPKPAVDAPIRDQQSYIEALKRCALAQTKREKESCE
jgi:hypothetical protein